MESKNLKNLECANCRKELDFDNLVVIADNNIKQVKYKLNIHLCKKCANCNEIELLDIVIDVYCYEQKILMERQKITIDTLIEHMNKSLSNKDNKKTKSAQDKEFNKSGIIDLVDTIAFLKNKRDLEQQEYLKQQQKLGKNRLN